MSEFTPEQIQSCIYRGSKDGYKKKVGGGCTCKEQHREQLYKCALYPDTRCAINEYHGYTRDPNPARICSNCPDVTTPDDAP